MSNMASANPKKRSASGAKVNGSLTKPPHNAKSGHVKSSARRNNEPEVKRKRPITQSHRDDDDEEEAAFEDENEQINGEEDLESGPSVKKPRMSKEERSALHAAQPHRTSLLPSYPLLQNTLLPMWEVARRADTEKEERQKAIKGLWEAVKGRVAEISRNHKGTRVLQTLVRYGGKEERLGVAMELQPQWRAMMESTYGKFLMSKLLRHVPQFRNLLIPTITPHLRSILVHAEAVRVLSDFFDLWATSKEKRLLVRGFYPKEVFIFDGTNGDEGLESVLERMGDGKGRERVLNQVEKTVLDVFNATQKNALSQGIFHRLVNEYLTCVYRFFDRETADAKMRELLEASLESLADIVHTKDGSAVVREMIVRGSAKDRKQILQNLKKHIEAMCKDSDAQMVLFTAFDCVDDTKLMGKAFVSDVVALAPSLVGDIAGRRALLYMLVPTSKRHYIPTALTSLADSAQRARDVGTSKKDPKVRRKELLGYASPGLLKAVEEHGQEWVKEAGSGLAVQEIMLHAEGDKTTAIETLTNLLREPYPDDPPVNPDQTSSQHILDIFHASRTYKTLFSGGQYSQSSENTTVINSDLSAKASLSGWNAIISDEAGGVENARRIAKGNAAFAMTEMISALDKQGKGEEAKAALGGLSGDLRKSERKGADLLAARLDAL